jgi:cellobiose-specific phosphotransferase system component IIC
MYGKNLLKNYVTDIKTILIMNAIFSKVGDFLSGLSSMLLSLVTLSIVAEVLFGVGVFGANVVENVMKLITMLGDGGFVGLVALLILWNLFNKDK